MRIDAKRNWQEFANIVEILSVCIIILGYNVANNRLLLLICYEYILEVTDKFFEESESLFF